MEFKMSIMLILLDRLLILFDIFNMNYYYLHLLTYLSAHFELDEEYHRYLIDMNTLRSRATHILKDNRSKSSLRKVKFKQENRNSKIPEIIRNNLPEDQIRDLSELRKRWRIEDDDSRVQAKTYHFWFKHWWGMSCSEIGKYVKGLLPNRWI
jgi:hypothetical protein